MLAFVPQSRLDRCGSCDFEFVQFVLPLANQSDPACRAERAVDHGIRQLFCLSVMVVGYGARLASKHNKAIASGNFGHILNVAEREVLRAGVVPMNRAIRA